MSHRTEARPETLPAAEERLEDLGELSLEDLRIGWGLDAEEGALVLEALSRRRDVKRGGEGGSGAQELAPLEPELADHPADGARLQVLASPIRDGGEAVVGRILPEAVGTAALPSDLGTAELLELP